MSKGKYPSIFSPRMEAIAFIIFQIVFTSPTVLKIGECSRIFPSFSQGIGSLSTRVFETRVATTHLPSHNHIHIAKNPFPIRDEQYKNRSRDALRPIVRERNYLMDYKLGYLSLDIICSSKLTVFLFVFWNRERPRTKIRAQFHAK